MSGFEKESLSLEETNKLRISLGLKPLEPDSDDEGDKKGSAPAKATPTAAADNDDDDDPLKNQDEKAERNYARRQEELRRQKEEQEIRDRIARAQNKRELSRKLKGPTLGDAEPTEGDGKKDGETLKWLKASRKRAKENAAKRMKEEAEEEAALAQAAKYGAEDLKGLKVAHDVDDFDLEAGGEERVLTLKDSKVLDDGDDELMDSVLTTAERDRINAERKKGAKEYTGLDDDEFGIDQVGTKRGVLSKYDADIGDAAHFDRGADGSFRLGGGGEDGSVVAASRREKAEEKRRENDRMFNRTMLSLDYAKNNEVSDYLQEGDVGFKKPKTKKKKKRETARVKLEDEDEEGPGSVPATNGDADGDAMMAEASSSSSAALTKRTAPKTENYIDDDELAVSLARARRTKAKKAFKKMTPEMIAQNMAAQREAEAAEEAQRAAATAIAGESSEGAKGEQGVGGNDGGLTFDDTSEFVRNIDVGRQSSPDARAARRRAGGVKRESASAEPSVKLENGTSAQQPDDAEGHLDASALLQNPTTKVKQEDVDEEDEEIGYPDDDGPPSVSLPKLEEEEEEDDDEEEDAGSTAEPLVSGGLASTLSILRNQGLIQEVTPEQRAREQEQKEYDHWLAVRRAEDQVRAAELAASKAQGSAKDQATREYENRQRELEDARRAQDKFRDYKPDIDIKYHDEFGRVLNNHEAWKRLSHTFHGRMPGKKKQEQRLQRIEEERKREKMLAGDTPSGMTKAFAERQERSGQAHMVLGVGAKNNAPQMMDILGPNTAMKPGSSADKNAKAKAKARATAVSTSAAALGAVDGLATEGARSSSAGIASLPRSVASPGPTGTTSMAASTTTATPTIGTTNGQGSRPGMRPAFAPVKTLSHVPPSSSTSSPLVGVSSPLTNTAQGSGGTGFKLALNSKRPAAGGGANEPASKRR